jgi:hypothetical protein
VKNLFQSLPFKCNLQRYNKGDHEKRVVMQGLFATRFGSLCSTAGAEQASWVEQSQAWIPERDPSLLGEKEESYQGESS